MSANRPALVIVTCQATGCGKQLPDRRDRRYVWLRPDKLGGDKRQIIVCADCEKKHR